MKKAAFIGLGNMGMPMALNILNKGFDVYGINKGNEKEDRFQEAGGTTGITPAEAAEQMDIVMTCLPKPEHVEEMMLGENGVITNASHGLLVIDFSTVSAELHEKIEAEAAQKGVDYLDAPVSGGTTGAEAGTLAVMVGGSEQAFEKAGAIFEAVGKNITYAGSIGKGTKVKLINQYMVGMHTAAVSEGLTMAEKAGVDLEMLHSVITNSMGQSKIYDRHYTEFIHENKEEPGFALELLLKDLGLANEMSDRVGVHPRAGREVLSLFEGAEHEGFGKKDMSSLFYYVKNNEK
ncbi:NAD(P)-dependent oxidoreductase [uncultured Marinococcus sp.]|jgi:3-hydroxyisobutyrate dehydrogenase|uniref:NAD(P)-dependent oxidoreductase n=1 Tax=uncultured Marinococcus sp. TaxID=487012 RepID=UPI00260C97F3|nr:NAD(P)-dependent oxidoreductase [uncultured Marinococcus sp.]